MKAIFVRELEPNREAQSAFLVQSKELRHDRNGNPYLWLVLADRTGALEARMWDGVAEVADTFDRDDFVEVKGLVQMQRNRLQMQVHWLRRLSPDAVEVADFIPHTARDVGEMWRELRQAVAAMSDLRLRALLEAVLDDPEIARRLRAAPAAKSVHHAVLGGLLEHVTSLIRLGRAVAPNYPFVDPDLLLAGIVLHDLGKIYELDYRRSFSYTTRGKLLGHMAIVLDLVREKAGGLADFPPRLRMLVEHMILSHHGRYEFGSPVLPMFPEALLLHHLDDLDSKMESMRASLANDLASEGEWTGANAALERPVLKKDRFITGEE